MISLYVKMIEWFRYQLPFSILQQLLGQVVYANSFLVYYAPNYMYNLIYLIFYPFMSLITVLAENWISAPYVAEGLSPHYEPNGQYVNHATKQQLETAKQTLLSHTSQRMNNNILFQLFDSLPSVPAIDTLGYYEGWFVKSNSVLGLLNPAIMLLRKLGIRWGKRYRAVNQGDPWYWLVFNKLAVPGLLCGNVDVLDIKFRGQVSMAMAYNQLPWIDYFRVLHSDDNRFVLLGIYAIKGRFAGFFVLESLDELDAATDGVHITQHVETPIKDVDKVETNGSNGKQRRKSHKGRR